MSEGTSSTTPASTVATSSPGLSTMGAGRIPHSDLDAAPRRKWKQPCALPLMSNGHLTTKPSEHRAPPSVSPSGRYLPRQRLRGDNQVLHAHTGRHHHAHT